MWLCQSLILDPLSCWSWWRPSCSYPRRWGSMKAFKEFPGETLLISRLHFPKSFCLIFSRTAGTSWRARSSNRISTPSLNGDGNSRGQSCTNRSSSSTSDWNHYYWCWEVRPLTLMLLIIAAPMVLSHHRHHSGTHSSQTWNPSFHHQHHRSLQDNDDRPSSSTQQCTATARHHQPSTRLPIATMRDTIPGQCTTIQPDSRRGIKPESETFWVTRGTIVMNKSCLMLRVVFYFLYRRKFTKRRCDRKGMLSIPCSNVEFQYTVL